METEAGLAHVWIDLLGDDDLAHGYLLDTAGDIVKRMGGTYSPDVAAISAEEFPITVGEEAIGLLIELDDTYESAVVYRLGRLVIYVGLEHATGADLRVPLQYLADQVEESAIAALLANTVAEESVVKPSYRFETSITAEALSGSWLVERTGNFHGDDLSCTVRTVDPQGDRAVEVRAIDGTVAMASGDGRFATVGAGNLEARTLLASCESWPLDAVAAGDGTTDGGDHDPTPRQRSERPRVHPGAQRSCRDPRDRARRCLGGELLVLGRRRDDVGRRGRLHP